MGIPRSVSYLRVFLSVACKKWMILQLLNKLSGKNEPQKLFPKTSFVRRIYNLIDSGCDFDGIFSVYTVWADIATGSVISLWDPDYCYDLWADETTFAYALAIRVPPSVTFRHGSLQLQVTDEPNDLFCFNVITHCISSFCFPFFTELLSYTWLSVACSKFVLKSVHK